MNRIWIFLIFSGVFLSCSVHAGKLKIDKPVQARVGDGCHISAKVPDEKNLPKGAVSQLNRKGFYIGDPLPREWQSGFNELNVALSCRQAEDPDQQEAPAISGGAKYNKQTKQWEKDLQSWFPGEDLSDPENRRSIDNTTRLINIQAVNSRGHVKLTDDSSGDEKFRARRMVFCLFKNARALCGYGDVAYLGTGKRGDLTPYALKIIQSIEFLPDEPNQSEGN